MTIRVDTIERRIEALHPVLSPIVERLAESLRRGHESGRFETLFKVFETYRSPVRQLYLLSEGTTKAGPWKSAHQFGLAVDFVPFVNGKWIWPSIESRVWNDMREEAKRFGLTAPIAWDGPHIEHPSFEKIKKILK